jgi:hypothetical protein
MGNACEEGGLFSEKGVAFGGEEGLLIPGQEAACGAKKSQIFASGAEFLVGLGKRGHVGMMKQQKVR